MSEGLKILAFNNGTASERFRLLGQADRINEFTEHQMYVTSYKNWNNDTLGADIVIVEMMTAPEAIDIMHDQGAVVIYEADDAAIDTYGKERKNLQHMGENWKNRAIDTIKKCDALTVTNKTLKDNHARFTKAPIYVLPNYIDFDWYGREKKLGVERNTDEIRIGWFGSRGHLEDLKMVTPALKRILEKYDNVKFVYCGFGGMSSDRLMTEIGWGEDAFKDLPRDRREFIIPVPPEYWTYKHRAMDFDIGIAPLIDDWFNACKTPIKWMEYAITGVPSVVSPLLYKDVAEHGKTAYIAKTEDEWFEYLSDLIENPDVRKEMGERARHRVLKKHDLDKHWGDWAEVYEEIHEKNKSKYLTKKKK